MRRNLRAGGDIKKKAESRQQKAGRARGFRIQELLGGRALDPDDVVTEP
jgi:hypothetical protein